LGCSWNNLTKLPQTLTELYCNNNDINELPVLPPKLTMLNCDSNYLTELNFLEKYYFAQNSYDPNKTSLIYLSCCNNHIINYCFPNSIKYKCLSNQTKQRHTKIHLPNVII